MKLSEQAVQDLADHLNDKICRRMIDTIGLTNDNSQRMFIATNAAALAFGMAARFLQASAAENGLSFDWPQCVGAAVDYVSKLAIDNPPDSLAEKMVAQK